MDTPKFTLKRSSTATVFRLMPEGELGWAYAIVDNDSGILSLVSDWGSWSYRWGSDPNSLGAPTLMAFLATRAGAHYVASKLCPRDQARQFDAEATVADWRHDIAIARWEVAHGERRRMITAEDARYMWDELDTLRDERSVDMFLELAGRIDGLEQIVDPLYEGLSYETTCAFRVLLEGIVPALLEACRAHVGAA